LIHFYKRTGPTDNMVEKVDMSLDAIIAADRTSKRGGGSFTRGAGRGRGGTRGASRGRIARNTFTGRSSSRGGYREGGGYRDGGYRDGGGYRDSNRYDARGALSVASGPGKLVISNLDYGVSEADLYELFSEFGNIKMAVIYYDRNGMSLGSAEVAFDRKSDAIKGLKQYNGVPLDGKPMRIEMTGSEREIMQSMYPAAPPPQRRSPSVPRRGSYSGDRRGGSYGDRRGGGRGGARGRGGASRGRGAGENKPAPSKEKLDEEMDAYMSSKDA